MTATIPDVETQIDLDKIPVCDHCDDPASHRVIMYPCHCAGLLCATHEQEEHDQDSTWDSWMCSTCDKDLGVGYGRWFYRTVPL